MLRILRTPQHTRMIPSAVTPTHPLSSTSNTRPQQPRHIPQRLLTLRSDNSSTCTPFSTPRSDRGNETEPPGVAESGEGREDGNGEIVDEGVGGGEDLAEDGEERGEGGEGGECEEVGTGQCEVVGGCCEGVGGLIGEVN